MGENGAAPNGMVLVPAGPFPFGREKQTVNLGAFWIDRDPVTNRDYLAFVVKTERGRPPQWPADPLPEEILDHPVVGVTFEDAQAYARFAEKDLPTPAQWEKAARGPEGRKHPWGSAFDTHRTNTKESAKGRTVAVSTLRDESPYGCRGMAGNVLEWTRGVADPKTGARVVKGCSFRTYLGAASWSYDLPPETSNDALGFRCVRAIRSPVSEAAPGEAARRA